MLNKDQLRDLRNGNLYAANGDKIGSIGEIYLDDQTNEAEWVTVNTGLFGNSESFVPLQGATAYEDGIQVQYDKDKVKDAPRVENADQHLDADQEVELYRYYGLETPSAGYADTAAAGTAAGTAATTTTTTRTETADIDRDRADLDRTRAAEIDRDRADVDDDASVTRHEERLNVGTERTQTGGARLRKFTVEDEQTVSVPVESETAHVTRRPVDGQAADGDAFRDETIEVDTYAERPVVEKETVAVEEVGLETEKRTENVQVSETLRKEQVEIDGEIDQDIDRDRR
ncbi:conserved domain-containing protein [Kytococcus aerolatus]|uniref:Conserved domain-containing protein n=1 Tax=Kytococcus aerolatus TaxID=592308 RepID=A0A212TZA6_9MICO|nr:PRC and DUF2382 domain-containing protein [Kytococcus aerolatus]SNC71335.1 conserved domain-containing protein [Kytococcus aerolatus]